MDRRGAAAPASGSKSQFRFRVSWLRALPDGSETAGPPLEARIPTTAFSPYIKGAEESRKLAVLLPIRIENRLSRGEPRLRNIDVRAAPRGESASKHRPPLSALCRGAPRYMGAHDVESATSIPRQPAEDFLPGGFRNPGSEDREDAFPGSAREGGLRLLHFRG